MDTPLARVLSDGGFFGTGFWPPLFLVLLYPQLRDALYHKTDQKSKIKAQNGGIAFGVRSILMGVVFCWSIRERYLAAEPCRPATSGLTR